MFLNVQSTQTSKLDSLCFFFKCPFYAKCAPFLLKVGEDFNIDIRRAKRFELMKIVLNTFEHIWFKSVFEHENY
jgi:hypothetical protein